MNSKMKKIMNIIEMKTNINLIINKSENVKIIENNTESNEM